MRHQQDTVEWVRSIMGPGNPVPRDIPAGDWPDADGQETRDWIMAAGVPRTDDLPSPHPSARPERVGRVLPLSGRVRRVAGPVAAALAVAGLIAGLTVAGNSRAHRPAAGALTAAGSGLPRFYVTLSSRGATATMIAEVHSSRTGQVLSQRKVGVLSNGIGITADRSDRAFVIDTTLHTSRGWVVGLVLLRVSANGHSTTLRRLPITLTTPYSRNVVDGIAVSPDGTRLAVALQVVRNGNVRKPHSEIVVYSLAGGAMRAWTAPREVALAFDPVWTNGSRQLTFLWHDHIRGNLNTFYTARTQIRVLDTAAAGQNLLASRVIEANGSKLGFIQSALAGPHDSPVIAAMFRDDPSTGASGVALIQLAGLSPAGAFQVFASRLIRYHSRAQMIRADTNCQVLGMDATGQHTLAYCPDFGRVDHGKFTPLPGNSGEFAAAW
jgi:hypothetical protein